MGVWLVLWVAAVFQGKRVLPYSTGAREIRKCDYPRLWNVVEEMTIAAGLAPVLARLLYLACSRQRKHLADASAARFTRFPDGLASALEKIAVHNRSAPAQKVSGALAALYIVNPVASLMGVFSTHPPTYMRVKILRSMGGRAGYVDYEAALRKIEGRERRPARRRNRARPGCQ